jgi:uncharacterized protein YgbK (DUF1537 family)
MHIEAIIVADDLTGALDTSTPFALAGRTVACATRPEALPAALASGAEIVVVSTASRALGADEAARRVTALGEAALAVAPPILFKKIDSRLKGNVGAETAALAEALGFDRILVAPAIPDQGRFTVDGQVIGRGVEAPLPIAPLFAGCGLEVTVADASSDADLDRIARDTDWVTTLAVGARGLGAALARLRRGVSPAGFVPEADTLFAVGSRDAITDGQVAALVGIAIHDAPLGEVNAPPTDLPAIIRSTGPFQGPNESISNRFAAGVAQAVGALRPHTLLMSGGDTALAILDQLGVGLVFPQGEAGAGLPWFLIPRENQRSIRAVVKSGGFGDSNALAALLPGA